MTLTQFSWLFDTIPPKKESRGIAGKQNFCILPCKDIWSTPQKIAIVSILDVFEWLHGEQTAEVKQVCLCFPFIA